MDIKKFNLYNYAVCAAVTLIAAVTYLLTMEDGASFWDCGEFIASSYKLEVGHPPGNPVFQLFARIITIPFSGQSAAIAVNALSALCSAATIMFLYLTTVFFAKRLTKADVFGNYTPAQAIVIFGSGAVAALAYTFSDTFWFSAVEGEVYAMSSLFTAMVLWAMTKWYEQADQPHSNRWIVLIALLMGLSIGIHLLNLLMIPALVYLYFFKKKEKDNYSVLQFIGILALGAAIVGLLTFVIIPYLPKVAAYVDLFFVNYLHAPFNLGAALFVIGLFAAGFWGAFETLKRGKVLANTAILCSIALLFGYSLFCICVIRSNAKTPTNEYQPDNPFTLVRYLSREQYGKTPLLYGQYFGAKPIDYKKTTYWAPMDGKYIETPGQDEPVYDSKDKMLFPRMHSGAQEHIMQYNNFSEDGMPKLVRSVKDEYGNEDVKYRKPLLKENFDFFIDYQMHWMYWRYFMWNFAGRQNDYHAPESDEKYKGNWECGIPFVDALFNNNHTPDYLDPNAPDYLRNNKGKNHYFLLPLLLGLLGLCFQFGKDTRGCWINALVFFMTGIAIVIYLNQSPMQVRERDYAYAGSFYAFSLWIGLAVAAVHAILEWTLRPNSKGNTAIAACVTAACLGVPALMAAQNWDDHDRSNRNTCAELAYNYLNSVGEHGILITHGDNDTFPLWYAQEVEGVRTDVRICNTSLLGTDWHIDQMKYACNESAPLPITVPLKQYLYGTNEFVPCGKRGEWFRYTPEEYYEDIPELIEHYTTEAERFKDSDPARSREFASEAQKWTGINLADKRLWTKGLKYNYYEYDSDKFVKYPKGYPIADTLDIKTVMEVFKDPAEKVDFAGYKNCDYICSRWITVPVNKENVIKYGIVDKEFEDMIEDNLVLNIPQYITKPDLFMLDLLCGYQWDRPIHMLGMGGDISIGIKDYLMWEGTSCKLVPFKTGCKRGDPGLKKVGKDTRKAYALKMYDKVMNTFCYDAISRTDWFVDYQNIYTFCGVMSYRDMFCELASLLHDCGLDEQAEQVLDKCRDVVKEQNFPLDMAYLHLGNEIAVLDMIELYTNIGAEQKAKDMADSFEASLIKSRKFFPKGEQISEYLDYYLYSLYELTGNDKAIEEMTKGPELETAQAGDGAVLNAKEVLKQLKQDYKKDLEKSRALVGQLGDQLLEGCFNASLNNDEAAVKDYLADLQELVVLVDETDPDQKFADDFYDHIAKSLGI